MKRRKTESGRENASRATRSKGSQRATASSNARADPVASLHRAVGNQAVRSFVENGRRDRSTSESAHDESEGDQLTEHRSVAETAIQPKLAVSGPTDRDEREADRVAEQDLRRKADGNGSASVDVERAASVVDGFGQQLSNGVRSFFEDRFGRNFGDVRIHTGERADTAARSIHARAFTLGRDVVFRSGEYRPDTREGKRLLAHELSHVVQQNGTRPSERPTLLRGDAPAERDAEAAARSVARGEAAGRVGTVDERVVARQEQPETNERERSEETDGTDERDDVRREAGYTEGDPDGIIHIAWTLDDGPTEYTEPMDETLGDRPTTWFIQRNLLDDEGLERLEERQQEGDEIAVHSMHESVDHVCWFPTSNGCNRGYDTTEAAMGDLEEFVKELRENGIRVSFVRLPTGLFSELVYYLRDEGSDDPGGEARKILDAQNGSDTTSDLSEAGRKVRDDLELVLRTLNENDLHLWGGGGENEVPALSWEAEASGVPEERTDNIGNKFKWAVKKIESGEREEVSFVVLAHDTSSADVTRVGQHIEWMEEVAEDANILIKYHRKRDLYEEIRDEEP